MTSSMAIDGTPPVNVTSVSGGPRRLAVRV